MRPRGGARGRGARGTSSHPDEPVGTDCLTHADAAPILATLRKSTAAGTPSLVAAACHKRVYVAGPARFIVWGTRATLHGKGSSTAEPPPTARCIERALALAHELAPFAGTILGARPRATRACGATPKWARSRT